MFNSFIVGGVAAIGSIAIASESVAYAAEAKAAIVDSKDDIKSIISKAMKKVVDAPKALTLNFDSSKITKSDIEAIKSKYRKRI